MMSIAWTDHPSPLRITYHLSPPSSSNGAIPLVSGSSGTVVKSGGLIQGFPEPSHPAASRTTSGIISQKNKGVLISERHMFCNFIVLFSAELGLMNHPFRYHFR